MTAVAGAPTVGRQVHYHGFTKHLGLDPAEPLAATVVKVHADGTLNLHVLYPEPALHYNGTIVLAELVERVPFVETGIGGWRWPPRA